MGGRLLSEVLALPVRVRGIRLGRPVEALLDAGSDRLVGFELRCGDGSHRFLPFAVAEVRPDEIAVESALSLVDAPDLDYYRSRTRRLSDLGLRESCLDDAGRVHDARSAA